MKKVHPLSPTLRNRALKIPFNLPGIYFPKLLISLQVGQSLFSFKTIRKEKETERKENE